MRKACESDVVNVTILSHRVLSGSDDSGSGVGGDDKGTSTGHVTGLGPDANLGISTLKDTGMVTGTVLGRAVVPV